MIGSGSIASFAISGLTASAPFPLGGFIDDIATREQLLLQPWAWLEFYEIETASSGTLRYVDFQDPNPDAVGTLPTQIAFDGNDYDSRKIERSDLKTDEGVAQFQVTIEDVGRKLIDAVDKDDGLNTEKLHLYRIPYDLIANKPQLALKETFRIRQALVTLGPDRVSLSVGLPSLADYELPNKIISRNRCWNDFNRRFELDSHCRYPNDDFEIGTVQDFGQSEFFASLPTTFPKVATLRKFGWSTINADLATSWKTSHSVLAGSTSLWTRCKSTYNDLKLDHQPSDTHRLQAIDQAFTQDFLVFVDVTTDINDPLTTTAAYPPVPTVFDAMIFGFRYPLSRLTVDVDTAGVGAYVLTWEYWNGSAYAALSGVTDGTSGFKTAGTNDVTFTVPADWTASGAKSYFFMRARVTTVGFTTIPLLSQAWSSIAHQGLYQWKTITGDFDIETQVREISVRAQYMVGFMLQDALLESDWIFWGNAENSSSVEKMRVRQSIKGIATDTDFDLTDGNERIRITRVGTAITAYSRVLDTDVWVQKSAKTWTGAPTTMRVGLVVASEVTGSSDVGANFRAFLFASGGFVDCDRSESDCTIRENLHQYNGFSAIPNQRTRG